MNRDYWNQVRNAEVRGVVSTMGYQIALITRLMKTIHQSSDRCLDLLEQLYTHAERLQLTWQNCDAIVEAIVEEIEHGTMPSFEKNFRAFLHSLAAWLEAIGVNDLRALEIGLAVIMNPKLKSSRQGRLRDALLCAFDDIQGDAWLIGAEVPREVKPLQLPQYFPFGSDEEQYEAECLNLIWNHIRESKDAYQQRGFLPPIPQKEQEKHLKIVAEFCITGLSIRKLATHLSHERVIDVTTNRAGISPSNISEIICDFERYAGVRLRGRN